MGTWALVVREQCNCRDCPREGGAEHARGPQLRGVPNDWSAPRDNSRERLKLKCCYSNNYDQSIILHTIILPLCILPVWPGATVWGKSWVSSSSIHPQPSARAS